MRRTLAGLVVAASLLVASPAQASHRDRCRYEDCGDRYGDGGSGGGQGASGGDYGHGKNGDQGDAGHDQCHSFCNNVIIIPDPTKKGGDQQPKWDNGRWTAGSSGITFSSGTVVGNGSELPTGTATGPFVSMAVRRSSAPIEWHGPSGMEHRRLPISSSAITATTGSAVDQIIFSSGLMPTTPRTPASKAGCRGPQGLARIACVATNLTTPTLTRAPMANDIAGLAVIEPSVLGPFAPTQEETARMGSASTVAAHVEIEARGAEIAGVKGFLPPNPGKIPQQIADFIKLVGDFVQSVIRFAV